MKVCIYAIMRDEAERVAAWAETTLDADARYVLDTGSTDGTHDELHTHGIAHSHTARFEPFRFDDARNTALAHCPEVDLCLRLDADELLEPGWREQLEAVYDPHVDRYRYRVLNHGEGWGTITRDDCHLRHGLRWRYPTHEVLAGPSVTMPVPLMTVHHVPGGRRPHHDANLEVLRQATIEYPGDHRMAFYYARELWYTGHWAACRTEMMHFLGLPGGWGAERAEAYRILAAIDDFPERWLWKAIGECPERREPWVDLIRLFISRGEYERGQTMWNEANLRTDETIYTTDPSCWGEPFEELRQALDAASAGMIWVPGG